MIASLSSRNSFSLPTSMFSFLILRVLTSPLSYQHSSAPIIYTSDLLAIHTGGPAIREIQARRGGGKMGKPPPPKDELRHWQRVNIIGKYVIYYGSSLWFPSISALLPPLKKREYSQVYEMSQISAFNFLEGDRQVISLFISRGEGEKEKAFANGKTNHL